MRAALRGRGASACWRAPWCSRSRSRRARAQTAPSPATTSSPSSTDLEQAAEIDVAGAAPAGDRAVEIPRSKNEPPPQKRPPIAPDLTKLPTFNVDIQFDVDTPIVQPESYQTRRPHRRCAGAFVLLPYSFLIVGHVEVERQGARTTRSSASAAPTRSATSWSTPSRSRPSGCSRSASARNNCSISARPTAPVNNQIQIMTAVENPEQTAQPARGLAAKKQPAKKR